MRASMIGIGTSVFAALLPFVTLKQLFYADINAKFFFVVLAADLLFLYAAYRIYKGHQITFGRRWLAWGLVGTLAVHTLSAFFGVYAEKSLWSDIFWSTGIIFFFHTTLASIFLAEFLRETDWSQVRRAIAVSSGFFGFLTIVGIGGLGYTGSFLWIDMEHRSLTIGNETYAGVYLLLALIVTLIELFRTERFTKWWYTLVVSTGAISLSPLLINIGALWGKTPFSEVLGSPTELLGYARSSSATMILLLVFLGGYFLVRRYGGDLKQKLTIAWGALFVAAILVSISLLFTSGSAVQEKYIQSSTAARIIVWEVGIEAFKEKPIFGWGPENFNFAMDSHFDNRLFLDENIGEVWFERAHNIFVDSLVSVGLLGTLALAVLAIMYTRIVFLAHKQEKIGEVEAVLLGALPLAHVLQLQTGFDTVSSYTLLGLMGGYALYLERGLPERAKGAKQEWRSYALAAIVVVLVLLSAKAVLFDEFNRQATLIKVFRGGSLEEQERLIHTALSRTSSFESYRIAYSSFLKGSLASIAEEPTPKKTELVRSVLSIYDERFADYRKKVPFHYRARMNHAYIMLIQTTLGENRLAEAKDLIRGSYDLSPGNPVTYILDSVAELYSGNIKEADALMQKALAVNPRVPLTIEAAEYLDRQKKKFPEISVLKLTNL